MRKSLLMLTAAAAVALATPAAAGQRHWQDSRVVSPVAGAVVGTAVGIGLYEGWFGSTAAFTGLGATTAGAITGGFIAGAGTAALVHAVITPCTGFHAVFGGSGCVNGKYVGDRYAR